MDREQIEGNIKLKWVVWKLKATERRQVKAEKHGRFFGCCKISPSPPLILQCSPILGSSSDQVYNLWYTTCKYRLQFCSNVWIFVRFVLIRNWQRQYCVLNIHVRFADLILFSVSHTGEWIVSWYRRSTQHTSLHSPPEVFVHFGFSQPLGVCFFYYCLIQQHMYQYSGVQGRVIMELEERKEKTKNLNICRFESWKLGVRINVSSIDNKQQMIIISTSPIVSI